MKKIAVSFILIMLYFIGYSFALSEQLLLYVDSNDKRGYMTIEGEIVIDAQWDTGSLVLDEYAFVENHLDVSRKIVEFGIIDEYGNYLFKETGKVYAIDRTLHGNAIFEGCFNADDYDENYFYFFSAQTKCVSDGWDEIDFYEGDGLIAVCNDDDRLWGYIDGYGSVVIERQFLYVNEFKDGYAYVSLGETDDNQPYDGIINTSGEWCYMFDRENFEYDKREPLANGMVRVYSKALGKYGYADCNGVLRIPYIYDEATIFVLDRAAVTIDGKEEFINLQGETMYSVREGLRVLCYDSDGYGQPMFWVFHDDDHYGFFAEDGSEIPLNPNWQLSKGYQEFGYAFVYDTSQTYEPGNEAFALIDLQGNLLTDFEWCPLPTYINPWVRQKYIAVENVNTKKFGVLSPDGTVLVAPEYIHPSFWIYEDGILCYAREADRWDIVKVNK